VIGNDIIDLELANRESDWRRRGFLDKIFTDTEQDIILTHEMPESMVWILWSMKEAAYKIFNRQYGIRAYIPLLLRCAQPEIHNQVLFGKVYFEENIFYTKTLVSDECIDTIAVRTTEDLSKIKTIDNFTQINKSKGLPEFYDLETNEYRPVSISHHGRFKKIVTL